MRPAALAAIPLLLISCSLVLEDPLPFQPQGAAPDAEVAEDAAPPVQPDAQLLDQAVTPRFDAATRPDARPAPDVGLDATTADAQPIAPDAAAPDLGPDAACEPEVCDGRDNDCDGEFDESDPEQCQPCGVAGARGLCVFGGLICQRGVLQCTPWLPTAEATIECDLLDNDCDGIYDEANEIPPMPSGASQALVAACGEPADRTPPAIDDCTHEPRRVGCQPAHACADPNCVEPCLAARRQADGECDGACRGADDPPRCRLVCHVGARDDALLCLERCPAPEASRWACEGGPIGPICAAVDCPPGTVADGRDCVAEPDMGVAEPDMGAP